jgi:hypothetical protein
MKITLRTIIPVTAAAIFFLGAATYFVSKQGTPEPVQKVSPAGAEQRPETGSVDLRGKGFSALKEYFEGVANEKGGRVAFDQMRTAVTDGNVDMHLLGHAVGDILYKQEGVSGMTACNNDFRNACSHSIVVGLFSDFGEGAIPMINDACKKAPGGAGAYTMCFHGLGHGVLSQFLFEIQYFQ